MRLSQLISLIIAAFITLSCVNEKPEDESIKLVTPKEMQTILDLEDVQLVDVRTKEEFEELHIANAQNIDFRSPTFTEDIKKLNKNKPVILYCRKGSRSAECAKKLQEAGFEKIYDLQGGLSKWKHSEFLKLNEKS